MCLATGIYGIQLCFGREYTHHPLLWVVFSCAVYQCRRESRRESITLVHSIMVVAQIYEKYHTTNLKAIKVDNKVLYDIG